MILTTLQYGILDLIRKFPGLRQKDLTQRCGLSTDNLRYHAKVLASNGYITVEADGRFRRYYAVRS